MTYKDAVDDWKSNDEWQFVDKEACWRFMFVKGQESMRQQLAAETMRVEIALRIKTEEHKCCSEDLMKLRESEQSGWKEAAIAWEVCGSIHEAFAKKKDALYSTRHSDFERHAEDARRMLSTESKEKVE